MKHEPKPTTNALFRHITRADDFVTWLRTEGDVLISSTDLLGGRIWATKAREIVATARKGGNLAARRKTLIALRRLLQGDHAQFLDREEAWRFASLHPDSVEATRAMLCADASKARHPRLRSAAPRRCRKYFGGCVMTLDREQSLEHARELTRISAQWLRLISFAAFRGAPVFSPNVCHYHSMLDPVATDADRLAACRAMHECVRRRAEIEDLEGQSRRLRDRSLRPALAHDARGRSAVDDRTSLVLRD